MSLTFSPAGDFTAVCDGLAAVTVLARDTRIETAILHALRRSVSTRELAASNGRYLSSDVRFHLPVEEHPDRPRLGDIILDADGGRHTILEVSRDTLGDRWRCTCRDPAIAYGLNDTIEVLQASYAKDDAGATRPTWTVERSGVRARVQPAATDIGVEDEARRTVRRVTIYVAEDVTIEHDRRLRDQTGTVYKPVAVVGSERIGELTAIDAEVSPWPFG